MIYLSQILRARVKDSSDRCIGRLNDILIRPTVGEYSPLQFLSVVRSGVTCFIPIDFVANISSREITLKKLADHIPSEKPVGNFTLLNKDIMDEQIVDLAGARVVRVNDLKIGSFEDAQCVLGIDVSFKGILRRLGLAPLDIFSVFKVTLIDWRKTYLVKGVLKLDTVAKDLVQLHPADLANIIEDLSVNQGSKLVDALTPVAAAHVVEEMDPDIQKTIIKYLGPERAHDIVEKMSVDETVDLLQMLPKDEAKQFLSYLQESKTKKIRRLINYPNDTAGGLMTTDYVDADPNQTVGEVIENIRRVSSTVRSLLYVYVVNPDDTLVGAVSLRSLLVAKPTDQLCAILKSTPENSVLRANQNVDAVIRVMTKYDLFTAAVLDAENKMVGVVTIDDVMRYLVPNA